MDRRYIIIGITAFVFLFVSCGQKHKAVNVVEDFIEQYAQYPDEMKEREFEHFDSTKVISDSLVLDKSPIPYPVRTSGRMLYHIRMSYVYKGDTLWQTFYLDETLEHVVAVK